MSNKLLEALKAVVEDIKTMHPIELTKALEEASTSEFAQTIDILNHFTSAVRLVRSDDKDVCITIIPIEDKQLIPIKPPCLFPIETNLPIESIPTFSQTDGEEPTPIGLVLKTPYSDTTTYREEWYTNPIDK